MSRKSKGTNAERELIHLFHSIEGWSAVRVAGSGSNRYPSPDIVAGNAERYLAIECKSTRDEKKYIDKEDIEQLKVFSARFGAEMFVAVRFLGCPWYFFPIHALEDLGRTVAVSKKQARENGMLFRDLVRMSPLGISSDVIKEEE